MDPILASIVGLLTGAVLSTLVVSSLQKARLAKTAGTLEARESEISQLQDRLGQMNTRIDEINAQLLKAGELRAAAEARVEQIAELERIKNVLSIENTGLKSQLATITETLKKDKEAFEEKRKILDEAKARLEETFKALSSDALKSNSEEFIKLAKSRLETIQTEAKGDLTERQKAIESMVQPIRDKLAEYSKVMVDFSERQTGQYTSMQDQVKALHAMEMQLKEETGNLVNALTRPEVRGNWGELTLRRVVGYCGLTPNIDVSEQVVVRLDDGKVDRPDMIINLPDGGHIIIDAKTPILHYMDALALKDEDKRKEKINQYAKALRTEIQNLSKKNYQGHLEKSPEFVIMFLPGEQFLGAALDVDPDLLEFGFQRNVILSTPASLYSILKGVAYNWQQVALADNAVKISTLGRDLYDRISGFTEHFQKVGKNLDVSVRSFNDAVGTFNSRITPSARRFKDLGITSDKELQDVDEIDRASREVTPIGYEIEGKNELPPQGYA